ncbi:rod-binding protein [Desulfosarcina ovata]|uniref:Flagellar protein FlgJ N-terminal domain-containing protein n=1 Tax=Desulfosarcina ovata subsp. ovata TaxID=2752305 RepID=A0A5K8A6X3_9BACT|nr:rod-binding protein [Desulfosarcina ovata]BBO88275.1 hypothetical protein DSCOOX_14550 [Desulfosarcina ovata subsp. ovata]
MSEANAMTVPPATFQLQAASTDRNISEASSRALGQDQTETELENASQQFESLLLNMMIREMRATVPDSGLFQESMAEEIFTSMLDEQYADVMAQQGGIGLSRMIVDQLGTIDGVSGETTTDRNASVKLK